MLSSTLHVSHLGGPPSSSSAMLAVVSPTSLPHLWPRSSVFVRVFYFGVCTKMLVAALFFAVILVPVVIVLLFRGGLPSLRSVYAVEAQRSGTIPFWRMRACPGEGGLYRTKLRYARRCSPSSPMVSCCTCYICARGPCSRLAQSLVMLCPYFFFRIVAIVDLRRPFGLIAQLTFFAAWSVQLAGMRCAVCLCIQPRHAVDGLCLPSSAPLPTGFMLMCSLAMC